MTSSSSSSSTPPIIIATASCGAVGALAYYSFTKQAEILNRLLAIETRIAQLEVSISNAKSSSARAAEMFQSLSESAGVGGAMARDKYLETTKF